MNNVLNLARPEIRELKKYTSARSLSAGNDELIFMDANENPYSPFNEYEFNRYPDPRPLQLKRILTDIYKIKEENLLITSGSDQAMDVLIRSFCNAGVDNILVCPPTFSMYETFAQIQGAGVVKVPLLEPDFQLNTAEIVRQSKINSIKIVFIPNPSAPLGHIFKTQDLEYLCQNLNAIVVIDEAYLEFSNIPSFSEKLNRYPNLVILRTLSKAYAMAGLRLGALIAGSEIINILDKVLSPYPLTAPSIDLALKALSSEGLEKARKNLKTIISEREKLSKELKELTFVKKVFPSVTNFILIEVEKAAKFIDFCVNEGFIVRSQDGQQKNTVRITISTPKNNKKFLAALKSFNFNDL